MTVRQAVDILRGKSVKSNTMNYQVMDRHKNGLKHYQDTELRRIIIKMLKVKMLKESFVSMKYMNTNCPNI